jgi:hypothetical protein
VVRDLFRSDSQPEQSYSERQLYEAALDRLSREISAVERITETEAIKEIEGALAKGPRRGPKPAECSRCRSLRNTSLRHALDFSLAAELRDGSQHSVFT